MQELSGGRNWEKILVMIAGDAGPDVFELYEGLLFYFYKKGALMTLDEFFENDPDISLDDIYPNVQKIMSIDGKIVVFPKGCQTFGLFYNKDIFDKAGISYPDENWTWDDFFATAKKLTRDFDNDGIIDQFGCKGDELRNYLQCNDMNVIGLSDVPISSDWKKIMYNDSKAIRLAEKYFRETHKAGACPTAEIRKDFGGSMFVMGRIAMVISMSYAQSEFREFVGTKFDWDVAPLPKSRSGKRKSGFYSHCWVMSKKAKSPKMAWELMKLLAGYEGAKQFVAKGIDMPIFKAGEMTDIYLNYAEKPKNKKIFIDALNYMVYPPLYRAAVPNMWQLVEKINYEIVNLNKDVKDTYLKYQPEMQKILDDFYKDYY